MKKEGWHPVFNQNVQEFHGWQKGTTAKAESPPETWDKKKSKSCRTKPMTREEQQTHWAQLANRYRAMAQQAEKGDSIEALIETSAHFGAMASLAQIAADMNR